MMNARIWDSSSVTEVKFPPRRHFRWSDAEEDLNLVEPRAVFWQVDEADPVADVREELAPRRHGLFVTSLPHDRCLGGIHEFPASWNPISVLWHYAIQSSA